MLCFQSCGLSGSMPIHPTYSVVAPRFVLVAAGVSCTSSRDFWREKEWNTLTPFRTSDQAAWSPPPHPPSSSPAPLAHTHLMRTCPQRGLPCPRARAPAAARLCCRRRGRTYSLCECFHSNIVRRFVGRERDRYPSLARLPKVYPGADRFLA